MLTIATVAVASASGAFAAIAAAGIAIGAMFAGVALAIGAAQIPRLSDQGAAAALQWKSFARYLRDAVSGRAVATGGTEFEGFLPYAAALGLAALGRDVSGKNGVAAMPAWFEAASGEDAGAFDTMMSASDSSSRFPEVMPEVAAAVVERAAEAAAARADG